MVKYLLSSFVILLVLASALPCLAQDDRDSHPECPFCGMDRHQYGHSRMLLRYDDGTSLGTCSIHCTAIELALNRQKTVTALLVADYNTKQLIDGKKAFWILGGSKTGVMTNRAKWAFGERKGAEGFAKSFGGKLSGFDEIMKATFEDMYEDIKILRQKRADYDATLRDIKDHPECKYCGMKRGLYAFSRMLIKYNHGPAAGTCSIHCSSIDLFLNTDKMADSILVGDYFTRRLIDAEKAVWVIGGNKVGVMSLRGKWAFENKKDAETFIKENGGSIATFDEAMRASFQDMHEILR